uniref:Uncharacterized protein n=1 Tax=Knipowitschia caucasica TaxID=637954 RepID=A0AAV2MNC9_KNICA
MRCAQMEVAGAGGADRALCCLCARGEEGANPGLEPHPLLTPSSPLLLLKRFLSPCDQSVRMRHLYDTRKTSLELTRCCPHTVHTTAATTVHRNHGDDKLILAGLGVLLGSRKSKF